MIKVSGEIVLVNPKPKNGIVIYTPSQDSYKIVFEDEPYLRNPVINYDKSKFLAIKDKSIVECNILNKQVKIIVNYNDGFFLGYPKYVPNHNAISYIKGSKLVVHDIDTENDVVLVQSMVHADYSWNKNGDTFLFSDYDWIYRFSVDNKIKEKLFLRFSPQYSADNTAIAYIDHNEKNDKLVMRRESDKKEWVYKSGKIHNFKISPNRNYIAIIRNYVSNMKEYEMTIWEFNSNKVNVLIDLIVHGKSGSFDWK